MLKVACSAALIVTFSLFAPTSTEASSFRTADGHVECSIGREVVDSHPGPNRVLCHSPGARQHPERTIGTDDQGCGGPGAAALKPTERVRVVEICGPLTDSNAPVLKTGWLLQEGSIGCIALSATAISCRSRVSGYAFTLTDHGFSRAHETPAQRREQNTSEETLLAKQEAEEGWNGIPEEEVQGERAEAEHAEAERKRRECEGLRLHYLCEG